MIIGSLQEILVGFAVLVDQKGVLASFLTIFSNSSTSFLIGSSPGSV